MKRSLTMKPKDLNELRKEIDAIDTGLIRMINKRGAISREIGRIKKSKKKPVYSPDRESQVYEGIKKKNQGPIDVETFKAVYREIMSGCLALEQPMKIAFLGPELTFTHQAALKKFGSSLDYLSCDNISDVFLSVEKGEADYGVVPIENSTEGAVNHTLDMFVDSNLLICSEVYLTIRENLLSRNTDIKKIKVVYSHPNVFGQCRGWIEKNIPSAKLRDVASTSRAAEMAAKNKFSACIASELAAKKYGLKVLARSIEDSATNVTRFLVIGRCMSGISGLDKTSIMFSVKDRPGVLHDTLNSFKKRGINLTKIESRPSKKKLWKYYFFVDMEGHHNTPKVKHALTELEKKCHFMKVLGSYSSAR
jgi:chorismate mutase / prephenate dehydratase